MSTALRKSGVAIASLALLASIFAASPVHAAAPEPITATTPGSPSTAYDAAVTKLESLRGTQTRAEIDAIANSGEQVEILVDDNDERVAAYVVEQRFQPLAISVRGPGCATTDACAWVNGTIPNGYFGTGQLNISNNNVKRIFAGDRTTTFWRGSAGDFVAPGQTLNFTTGRNYNSITRS